MSNSKSGIYEIDAAIISTLNYFGLFKYPLNLNELHRFLSLKIELSALSNSVNELVKTGKIFISSQGFYSVENNPSWSVERERGNVRADKLLKESSRYVRKISNCPFVSSIAISGSLSKYYAGEDADIDYFIVTKKNRLWISRTLLHFFKKFTFIGGNEHYYCMNYFVDESALEIDQKNIYSAIETVTLIPVYNKSLIYTLKQNNQWVDSFLPNERNEEDLRFVLPERNQYIKGFFESIINMLNPLWLNRKFMKMTDQKWRKKWRKKSYPMENYNQAFYTTINISKNHPANYQKQILTALDEESELSAQPSCKL